MHDKSTPLTNCKIYFDESPFITIHTLKSKCKRLKQKHNIEAVIIDYLQLISSTNTGIRNKEKEKYDIMNSLKLMAIELNIPVIVLSQLDQNFEKNAGSLIPSLIELRQTGVIEQLADLVIFLWRPEYYNITIDEESGNKFSEGLTKLIIAKNKK